MSVTDEYLQIARCGSHEAAFHGLNDLGPQVIPSLVWAYQAEADPEIRALIVRVVWQHRVPTTIEFLADALDDPHPDVWKEALDGLVCLATPAASTVLRGAVKRPMDDDGVRRAWVEEAIEQIDDAIAGQRG